MKARSGGKTFEIDSNRVRGGVAHATQADRAAHSDVSRDTQDKRGSQPCRQRGVITSAGSNPAPAPTFLPKQVWFMPGPLPGMNDFISTGNRFRYATAKKKWHKLIAEQIQKNGLAPMQRVFFRFTWYEQHKRRNPDNITSIGKKFIFDALQESGILGNDGWKQIDGWEDRWLVNAASPGVMIEMEAVEVDPW